MGRVLAAAAALLLGCSAQSEPRVEASDAAVETAPSDTLPHGWTRGIVRVEGAPRGVATLADVRLARHPGYDRFVLEFAGEELPGYHLEYVDRPVRQCGSGEAVELAGDGWLSIRLEPARAHDDEGRPSIARRNLRPDLPVIRQARIVCDFEAQVEWVLGVSSPNRYRVLALTRPTRLVVDVRR